MEHKINFDSELYSKINVLPLKGYKSRCVADARNDKFKIRIYSKENHVSNISSDTEINTSVGYSGKFITEVPARFSEWFQSYFRFQFDFNGKSYDIWYEDSLDHKVYGEYLFKLIVEQVGESQCK